MNMHEAYQRLSTVPGWIAISTGPQQLPASSGDVFAFKFRDPDGHPVELLAYPENKIPTRWAHLQGLFLGIDHSAISVSDSASSIMFYEKLGLQVSDRSLNHGCEQDHLDGLRRSYVEVTALTPSFPTPHVELLCYRSVLHERTLLQNNDVAATRLLLEADDLTPAVEEAGIPLSMFDPDNHRLLVISSAEKRST